MNYGLEEVNILKGHKGDILSCITFENYFITAGYDQKIFVWDALTNKIKLQINDAHDHIISCLDLYVHREKQIDSNKGNLIPYIISSSWDKTCKVFNFHSGKLISTFIKHSNRIKVVKIVVENDFSSSIVTPKVISGDDNSKIYLWTMFQGEMLYCLEGHFRGILNIVTYSISPFEIFFASSSLDSTIRIWDLFSGELKHVIHTTSSKINCLVVTSLSQCNNNNNSLSNHSPSLHALSNKITLPSLSTTHNNIPQLGGTVDSAAYIIVSSLEAKESCLEAALPIVIPTLLVTGDQDCNIYIYQACGSAIGSLVYKLGTLEKITSLYLADTLDLTYFNQYINKSNGELTNNVKFSVTNPYLLYVLKNGTLGFVDLNTIEAVINLCGEITHTECESVYVTSTKSSSSPSYSTKTTKLLYNKSSLASKILLPSVMTHVTTGDVTADIKEFTNQNSMNESAVSLQVQRFANSNTGSNSSISSGHDSISNDTVSSDTKLNIHKQLLKKSKSKMRRLSSFVKDMSTNLPPMEKNMSFASICEETQLSLVPASSSLCQAENIEGDPYEPVLCCYLSAKIVFRDSQDRVIFKENENGNGEIITYHQYLFLGGKDGMLLSKLYVYAQRATVAEKNIYNKETTERIDKSDKSKRKTLALTHHQSDVSHHPILTTTTTTTEISSSENKSIPTLREPSSTLRHSVPIIPTHHSSYHQEGNIENINLSLRTTTTNEGKSFNSVINTNTTVLLHQDCSNHISTSEDVTTVHTEERKDEIIPMQQSQYHSWKESIDIIAANTSDADALDMTARTAQKFMNTNKSVKNRIYSRDNIISDPSTGALWPSAVMEQVRSSLKRVKIHSKQYNKYLNKQPLQQLVPIASKPLNNYYINSPSPLENNNDLTLSHPRFLMRSRTKLVAPLNHRHQIIQNKPHYFCDHI